MKTTIAFRRGLVWLGAAASLMMLAGNVLAQSPAWWTDRGVITSDSASDFAMANQGQAKWFATKAEEELQARLPAGFDGPIYTMPLPEGDNYLPINQGQAKNLVKPLYDRIQQVIDSLPNGPEKDAFGDARPQGKNGGTYPWTTTTSDDSSYAPVNLGQLKFLLSFNFSQKPTVTVTATDPTASETGPDSGEFTIIRVGGDQSSALTVIFQLSGTATEGADYQIIGTQVIIPANQSSATVTVLPIPDTLVEGGESVILTLATSGNYVVGTPDQATVTISDHLKRVVYYGPTSGGLAETTPEIAPVGTGPFDSQIWTPGDANPQLDWNNKTTADFAAFDAIIFGDEPICTFGGDSHIWDAAIANRNVWSAAVLGNVVIVGTDPDDHGKSLLVHQAVTFATSTDTHVTGLYVALGCYYHYVVPTLLSPVPVELLGGLGTFKVLAVGDPDVCPNNVQKLSDHPVLASVDDAFLSNWNCSTHEGFHQWPDGFQPLAIVTDVDSKKFTPGFQGLVYILARGVTSLCPELTGGSFNGDGLFSFTVHGKTGDDVVINASTDGETWTGIATVTLAASTQSFTDPDSGSYTHRNYRANHGACCSEALGYIKKTVPAHQTANVEGEAMLANQLDAPPNTLGTLLPTMPDGTKIRKWNAASQSWTDATYHTSGGWDHPDWTLVPGEGAMIKNPLNTAMTVTFIGNLVEGILVNTMPAGKSIQASQVPEAGAVDFLGLMNGLASGATVYQFNVASQGYDPFVWNGVTWNPTVPVVDVGESFFVVNTANGDWMRDYSTCCNAPRILTQPTDQTACLGGSVTFTVLAAGANSLQYQWSHDGVAINGATSPTFTINPVSAGDAGKYKVTISDCGAVVSREALLVVDVVANDDNNMQVFEGQATIIHVLDNDPDPTLPITSVTQGANGGTVTISADQKSVIYTSLSGYTGSDTFTYSITRGQCTATATVTVSVNARPVSIVTQPQDKASLVGGSVTLTVDAIGTATLLYQWNDENGTPLSNGGTTVGGAVISGADTKTMTLTGVQLADSGHRYYVTVSNPAGSIDSENAVLNVRSVNLPPIADSFTSSVNKNIAKSVPLTGSDPDSDPLTFTVVAGPTHGTLTGTAPNLTYTPATGYTGGDTFTYKVNDGFVDSATATVTINIVNTAPVAFSQAVTVIKNTASSITLGGFDANGDTLEFVHANANGTLTGTGNHLTYTPNTDYTGADSFTFTVNDGTVNSSPATVSINVIDPTLMATVAKGDIFQVQQDSTDNQLDVLANDKDSNGNTLVITAKSDGGHGTVSLAADGLSLFYTPANGFYGVDTFTYTIDNGHGNTPTATVTVFVNKTGNNNPTAADDSATLAVGVHTATLNLLNNDSNPDSDGDPITIYSVDQPSMGTITDNGGGQITYTRDSSKFGTDSFTYVITDGNGGYATATVTVDQVDSDGNGLADEWEIYYFGSIGVDPNGDPDGDGLSNLQEYHFGTNPLGTDDPVQVALNLNSREAWQAVLYTEINADPNIDYEMSVDPSTFILDNNLNDYPTPKVSSAVSYNAAANQSPSPNTPQNPVNVRNYVAKNGFWANRANIVAVYDYYQKVYLEKPDVYYWAGLGRLVGAPVYAGLCDAQDSIFLFKDFQKALIQMNIDIMDDIAWQLEAYRVGGIKAIRALNSSYPGLMKPEALGAWEAIDQGEKSLQRDTILSGNKMLAHHEQLNVLQPDYDNFLSNEGVLLTTMMDILSDCPVWGPSINNDTVVIPQPYPGRSFSDVVDNGVLPIFEDRWQWVTSTADPSALGIWPTWTTISLANEIFQTSVPLRVRAWTYSRIGLIY